MNKVIMSGNLGSDPEIRYSQAGKAVASLSLAVRKRFVKEGESDTDWFKCTAFSKTAEFCEKYLHKGSKVIICGEIHNDNYEKDGVKHYGDKITIDNIEFGDSKKDSEQSNTGYTTPAPADNGDEFMNIPDTDMDELPFN